MSNVVPHIFGALIKNNNIEVAKKVLDFLIIFRRHLDDYLYLVIPSIVRLIETTYLTDLRIHALKTLSKICQILNISEYSGRIVHPLCRILKENDSGIRKAIFDTFCVFVKYTRYDFAIFVPMISSITNKYKIQHPEYEELIKLLLKNQLPEVVEDDDTIDTTETYEDPVEVKLFAMNHTT